jgi:hypothetical protein
MTSTRFRAMPMEKQYLAKKAELVSTVLERVVSSCVCGTRQAEERWLDPSV